MENIQEFFDQIKERIEDSNFYYQSDFDEYPSVENVTYEKLILYKHKIVSKILLMPTGSRNTYANLTLESIDYFNIQNRISTFHKENSVSNEEFFDGRTEHRLYRNLNGQIIDITDIWDYCTVFISLIWEAFMSLGIDLKKITGKNKSLRGDYGIFFKDPDYVHAWILEQKGNSLSNDNISLSKQILAIQSMLSELGVDSDTIDKTRITAFMQFLTNREVETKPSDTRIYQIVRGVREGYNLHVYNDYCDSVAQQFENIGLNAIAEKIKKGKE